MFRRSEAMTLVRDTERKETMPRKSWGTLTPRVMRAAAWAARSAAVMAFIGTTGLIGAACSDDDDGDTTPTLLLDTILEPQIVFVGQSATVTCRALDDSGAPVVTPTRITVSSETGITLNGATATANAPGTYQLTCETESGQVDETPANLYAIGPDDADRIVVETTLSAAEIAIGATADVTCRVTLDGQTLADITTDVRITPAGSTTLEGHTITGTADGDVEVACGVAGTDFVDLDPAELRIGKGDAKPANVVTTLASGTAAAGESVGVTCKVLAEDGEVLDTPTVIVAPNGVGVPTDGAPQVTAQQVGEFEITCRLEAGDAAVAHEPATLTVVPGPAATIDAWADPSKPSYKPKDHITIVWEAKDAFDNVVPDAAASVAAPTSGVLSEGDHKYQLEVDGNYTFTVSLDNGADSDDIELTVDGSGPVIVITTPERGMTFDGEPAITVAGTIQDAYGGVASMTINGKTILPDEAGNWSAVVDSVHGMNPILVEAVDLNQNTSKATVTWYYSTDWVVTDKATPDQAWLEKGVQVWLSQELIDDYDHTGPIDDLAHLLEVVLTNADLTDLIGEVVLFEQTYADIVNVPDILPGVDLTGDLKLWIDISEVSFGTATLNLDSRDGGIDLAAQLGSTDTEKGMTVSLQFHIQFTLWAAGDIDLGFAQLPIGLGLKPPPALVTTTTLTFDSLGMDTSFDISMVNEQLAIQGQQLGLTPNNFHLSPLADAEINLGSLAIEVAGFGLVNVPLGTISLKQLVSGLDQLIAGLVDPLVNAILPLATGLLDPLIADVGGGLLQDALQSLEIDQSVAIPQFFDGQPEASVDLKARIGDVAFTDEGAMLGLDGASVATKVVDREVLGTLLRDGCGQGPENYSPPTQGAMELALRMDLINELLFGFWYNGGLNMTLGSDVLAGLAADLPLDNAEIKLQPLLPPVMTDCNSKGTLKLQLGEAYLEAKLGLDALPIEFKAWLSVEIDVGLVAEGDELGVIINGISQFQMELFDVKGAFEGNEGALEALIKSLVDTLLGDLLTESLAQFPLPTFDLSSLSEDLPEGTQLKLGDLSITKTKGYLQIEGALQ